MFIDLNFFKDWKSSLILYTFRAKYSISQAVGIEQTFTELTKRKMIMKIGTYICHKLYK